MNHDTFILIATTARELRTEAATYTLLEAYARNGCATYPEDSELFRELWPNEQVPGYVLRPYPHMNTHTVFYAEIEPRTTHTPGPWYTGAPEWPNKVFARDRHAVAMAECSYMNGDDEDIANARLIAAAPDLLAVAQRLAAWGRMEIPSTDANLTNIIHDALAAIAKAEGEQA